MMCNDNLILTNQFCTLGSIFIANVWIACTVQCNTLIGVLKTTGWLGHVYWEEQDLIWLLWTIKLSYELSPLTQTKIGACMYLCVCGCDLPWAYDQELGTINHSVRESVWFATFWSYVFRHVYIHICVYIPIYICSYAHLCLYTYKHMGVHIHICISVCVSIHLLLDMYVTTHVYQYININRTCSWCGTQRFEVMPSDWVVLVPPCKGLVTEIPWCVHHWNQHGLVFKCGVFCKLAVKSLPNVDEFVGSVEHFAQHCTWLCPPNQ